MSNKTSDRHAQPLEGGFKPTERKGDAAEPSIQAQGLNTLALGHIFLLGSWRSVLWILLCIVLMSFLAVVGEPEHRPMSFLYAFFLGGTLGSVNFVFQPKGEELRAFGLTTAQIRRLAASMWGVAIPASALYLVIVVVVSRTTGGMLSSGRLLLACVLGYLLLLAYAVYRGWSGQVDIRNDAVGEQDIAVRAEKAKKQKAATTPERAGVAPGHGDAQDLSREERAAFDSATALEAAVIQPLRLLGRTLTKWECGLALALGLVLAFWHWVADTIGVYLGIVLVGALIGSRWLFTAYGLPKNYVQWLAFGGSRRAWRRAALEGTIKTSWSVPVVIVLVGYPALLNSGSALREKFSDEEILAGAPMLGLIVLFLISGTTLLTALATLRWPKAGALTLGGFLAYGMAMVTVLCFQSFFTGDVDPLPRAVIGVLISAFYAVIAAWVFYARILEQDARNASHIQTLVE